MNELIFQALCGFAGAFLGVAIVTAVAFTVNYFSRDERWYRQNKRAWKAQERATRRSK